MKPDETELYEWDWPPMPGVKSGTWWCSNLRWEGDDALSWWDGTRSRALDVDEVLADDAERLRVRDRRGLEYEFRPLTLEGYNRAARAYGRTWTDLAALKRFLSGG